MYSDTDSSATTARDATLLVPVEAAGREVLLRVRPNLEPASESLREREVAGWTSARLDDLFEGLAAVAEAFTVRFETSSATRMRLAFGCDVSVKSGSLVAVIGNASAKASFTVELEYEKPGNAVAATG